MDTVCSQASKSTDVYLVNKKGKKNILFKEIRVNSLHFPCRFFCNCLVEPSFGIPFAIIDESSENLAKKCWKK